MRNETVPHQIRSQGDQFGHEDRSEENHCAAGAEDFVLSTGAVAVTRARDWFGIFRCIKVLLDEDEHELGAVPYGERRVFHLPAGVHSLSIGMDWCRSLPYEVEVRPGHLVELEGSIRWRGFLFWLGTFAMFILPGRAFVIRPLAGRGGTHLKSLWEGVRVVVGIVVFFGLCLLLLLLFSSILL
jgi:hypothetical protein